MSCFFGLAISMSWLFGQDKCLLLILGYKHENIWARIGEVKIWESSKQKLLGVVIDRDLSFNEYVSSLCKKAGTKLSVLSRLSNLMSFQQRRLSMKFESPIWILSISLDVSW